MTEEEAPVPRRRLGRTKSAPEIPVDVPAPARRKVDALPDLAGAEVDPAPRAAVAKPKRGFGKFRKSDAAKEAMPQTSSVTTNATPLAIRGEQELGLLGRISRIRPSPRHIILAVLVLFAVMRPWLVLGLVVFVTIVLIGVFLIAGYDGFWQGVVKANRWYAKRRPSRAAALHERLDRFAVRWDSILDRFPEGTVDGFYLPDFAELASADLRHDEAVERRLAGMQEKGA